MSSIIRAAKCLGSWVKRLVFGFGRAIKDIFWGLYRQDALGLSAQVAYSALFSLFPFFLLLNALVAYIPGADRMGDWLLAGLRNVVSVDSRLYEIVQENVFFEVGALSATLLSLGVILTLWSASGAVMVLLKAVQRAYGLEETRSWQSRRSVAVLWAVAGVVIIPIGVLFLVFGSLVGDWVGQRTGVHSALHLLWIGLRWPVVFLLLVGVLGVFFRHGSSVRHPWYAVLPGSVFAVGAIIAVTEALSWFVSQRIFEVRWLTYGVIGTVIVLLFWAFLIGLMVLIGAQINALVSLAVDKKRVPKAEVPSGQDSDGQLIESPNDE
jgi:membrane protein